MAEDQQLIENVALVKKTIEDDIDALKKTHGDDLMSLGLGLYDLHSKIFSLAGKKIWDAFEHTPEMEGMVQGIRDIRDKADRENREHIKDRADQDREFAKYVVEYLEEKYPEHLKLEVVSKMDNDIAFDYILQIANNQLYLVNDYADDYLYIDSSWVYLLSRLVRLGNDRYERICKFTRGAFDILRESALRKEELLNQTIFGAVARLIGELGDPSQADLLMREFAFAMAEDEDVEERYEDIADFYELNLAGGYVALALAAVGYEGDLSEFDKFLKSYEWRYQGDDFVMQVRYAQWMICKDDKGALDYLENLENTKGLSFAVTALADLNARHALSAVKARQEKLENPVTIEVFLEAIDRLNRQDKVPDAEDRMIWLFGKVSSTERALGADSDNVFMQRTMEKTKDNDMDIVYEVDDSAKDN